MQKIGHCFTKTFRLAIREVLAPAGRPKPEEVI